MPEVTFNGETIECEEGEILRDVLMEYDLTPHQGIAKRLNCGGHGTCGTCRIAVVEGGTGENEQSTRLKLSTDANNDDVRLSCQFEVTDDIVVEKP